MNIDNLKEAMQAIINEGKANDLFGDLHRHKLLLEGEKIAKANGLKLNGTQLNDITTQLFLKNLKGMC